MRVVDCTGRLADQPAETLRFPRQPSSGEALFRLGGRSGVPRSPGGTRAAAPEEVQLAGVAFDGRLRSDLEPYLSAQTTWESDAHFGRPAMRTGVSVHPPTRERLSASPARSPVAHGPVGP